MAAIDGGAAFLRTLAAAERRLAAVQALSARRRRVHAAPDSHGLLAVLIPGVLALAAATGAAPGACSSGSAWSWPRSRWRRASPSC